MKKKIIFSSFFAVYLFVLPLNIFPALKHPDTTIEMTHVISSICFIIGCLLLLVLGHNFISLMSLGGTIAGILIFILTKVEWLTYEVAIMDLITNIEYPLYIIFVVPLFGINYWLNVRYELFSLGASLFYLIIFTFSLFNNRAHSFRR